MSSKNKVNAALVKKIKDKFGTISAFIAASGMEEKAVRFNLYRDNPKAMDIQAEIEAKVKTTPVPVNSQRLDEDVRAKVRGAIYAKYPHVTAFVAAHPEFTSSYISYVVNKGIKYRNKKVDQLFQILNLK